MLAGSATCSTSVQTVSNICGVVYWRNPQRRRNYQTRTTCFFGSRQQGPRPVTRRQIGTMPYTGQTAIWKVLQCLNTSRPRRRQSLTRPTCPSLYSLHTCNCAPWPRVVCASAACAGLCLYRRIIFASLAAIAARLSDLVQRHRPCWPYSPTY